MILRIVNTQEAAVPRGNWGSGYKALKRAAGMRLRPELRVCWESMRLPGESWRRRERPCHGAPRTPAFTAQKEEGRSPCRRQAERQGSNRKRGYPWRQRAFQKGKQPICHVLAGSLVRGRVLRDLQPEGVVEARREGPYGADFRLLGRGGAGQTSGCPGCGADTPWDPGEVAL